MESDFDFNDVLWTLGCYYPNPEVARHNFCEKMKEVGLYRGTPVPTVRISSVGDFVSAIGNTYRSVKN